MYLFDIPRVVVRRLKDERLVLQSGVEGDALHRVHADKSFTELFVTILVRSAGIFAVVEVYGAQLIYPYDPVETRQHAVEVADDIICVIQKPIPI